MELVTAFSLLAAVLTLSALAAGIVERTPLTFPMIFLGLGFLLARTAPGVLVVDVGAPALDVIATLTLSLVLFLDAVNLERAPSRKDLLVPLLVLGPGTVLVIGLIAAAAAFLLDFGLIVALLLGAVLSSTDPVVLRDVVRDQRLPSSVRRALRVEAGTNDIVVLPVILVLVAVSRADVGGTGEWILFGVQLFVLGPAAGFLVGAVGSWLVGKADARFAIREEYQALYGIGLVLGSYAAGEAVGGDGFLAAFAAGLAVSLLNNELCECFLDFGEAAAEMAMLLAFVLFGVVLSTTLTLNPVLPTLALAVVALVIARPLAVWLVLRLRPSALSPLGRRFIAWFGPRGLNSLLFALIVAREGVRQGDALLSATGVVVVVSVVVHGVSAHFLSSWYARKVAAETLPEERESTVAGLFPGEPSTVPRVSVPELAARLHGEDPPVVLDVRSRSQYERDGVQIPGSVRVAPDEVAAWARGHRETREIVTYCT